MNTEAYNYFEGVISDKKLLHNPSYNWTVLTSNEGIRKEYIAVKNRYEALQAESKINSTNISYNNFVTSHNEAAENIIPIKPKTKCHGPWESHITNKHV